MGLINVKGTCGPWNTPPPRSAHVSVPNQSIVPFQLILKLLKKTPKTRVCACFLLPYENYKCNPSKTSPRCSTHHSQSTPSHERSPESKWSLIFPAFSCLLHYPLLSPIASLIAFIPLTASSGPRHAHPSVHVHFHIYVFISIQPWDPSLGVTQPSIRTDTAPCHDAVTWVETEGLWTGVLWLVMLVSRERL